MTPAEWLDQLEHIDGALPITMSAMTRSWEGAVYKMTGDGERPCIYMVGKMPTNAVNLCFRFPDDDRDWFVGTYFQEELSTLEPHQLKYHPFGKTWTLHPWTHEEDLDHHQDRKCKRIEARITWN